MPNKDDLLEKLQREPTPQNFTIRELDLLMSKCGCEKKQGGRGSGVRYVHSSGTILAFDLPHPGKALYRYHIKMVIEFLERTGEL